MKRIFIPFIALLAFFTISSVSTNAQFEELGLSLRPAIFEIIGDPGITRSTQIVIESNSTEAVGVTVDSRSLLPNDPEIDQTKRKLYDASSWIVPVQSDFILVPKEQRTIDIQIVIPEDASPGGHYALVTFSPVNIDRKDTSNQTSVQALPEITSLVLITVPGDIEEFAQATAVKVQNVFLNSKIESGAVFHNSGNIHLLPSMRTIVKTNNGDTIEVLESKPQLSLPNTSKTIEQSWSPEGDFGLYYFEYEINYGSPIQTLVVRSETFLVLPAPWLIATFIGLTIAGTFGLKKLLPKLYRIITRKKKFKIKNTSHDTEKKADIPTYAARDLDTIASQPGLVDTKQRQISKMTEVAKKLPPTNDAPKKHKKIYVR